jgi:lipopolysaccharide export system protein LptC
MKTWLGRIAWLLLAAAAGASSWLVVANRGGTPSPNRPAAANRPDYILHDAVVTRYARAGTPRYILHSQRIAHRQLSGVSLLTAVGLDYYPNAAPYWHLDAEHGSVSSDGDRIALSGNVHAHQPMVAVPIRLATSRLHVQLAERRIRSDAQVTLRQGDSRTHGTGMRANLNTGKVHLLHKVTSHYAH